MYLLDTNVLSEARKARSGKANPNVVSWLRDAQAISLFLSAICILELEWGARRIERRDARQGLVLRQWLDTQVIGVFSDRILPVDTAIARRCAQLHIPDPRADRDALIAATAMVHGLTVVTRNVRDFEPTGVSVIDPWQYSA